MAKGIRLPITAENGRLAMLGGDDYIAQLVATALGDNGSNNPFQDIGLGQFMIFGLNDSYTEGEIRERVQQVFASLEADQLAKLAPDAEAISFTRMGNDGKLHMSISFINIETQEQDEIEVPIPGE